MTDTFQTPKPNLTFKGRFSRVKGKMSYEAQKAKFSLGKASREELFDQVKTLIDSLASLLIQNDEVVALRSNAAQQTNTKAQRALLQLWRHAQNVYVLLSKSWRCGCRKDHCADLLLQHRTTPEVQWEIVFHFSTVSLQFPGPWTCQTTRIAKMEQAAASNILASHVASSPSGPPTKTETKPQGALRLVSALKKTKNKVSAGAGKTTYVIP